MRANHIEVSVVNGEILLTQEDALDSFTVALTADQAQQVCEWIMKATQSIQGGTPTE